MEGLDKTLYFGWNGKFDSNMDAFRDVNGSLEELKRAALRRRVKPASVSMPCISIRLLRKSVQVRYSSKVYEEAKIYEFFRGREYYLTQE